MGRWLYICGAVALSALLGCLEPRLRTVDPSVAGDAGQVCSPMTCTGCCLAGVCLGGNADSACGYDGRRCRACDSQTVCVAPGACVSVPGDGGFGAPYDPDAGVSPGAIEALVGRPDRCVQWQTRTICF